MNEKRLLLYRNKKNEDIYFAFVLKARIDTG